MSNASLTRLGLAAFLVSVLGWFVLADAPAAPRHTAKEFSFHHDHVLGTSLDLWIVAPNETSANYAEGAILDEIERLRLVFSTYDPQSEISRLNRADGPVSVSADM